MRKSVCFIAVFVLLVMAVSLPVTSAAADRIAYVLNSVGETLSRINLETGAVENDFITIGSDVYCYPSQIVIRDTLLYAVVSNTDEIQVINLNTDETEDYIPTGQNSNPYWIEFLDEQYLLVTLMLTSQIMKIDYTSGQIVGTTTVGKSPAGILVAGDKAYIACTGFDFNTWIYDPGQVYVYDIPGDEVVDSIAVDLNPQYLILDTLGRVHVVCTGDYASVTGRIDIIDTASSMVETTLPIGGTPGQITIGPDHIAWIASAGWEEDGFVFTYNSLTDETYHDDGNPIEVDLNCMAVTAFQDSTCFTGSFTDYINVIDSAGGSHGRYAVGGGPVHVAFNYQNGDVDGNFELNILDVSHLINWLYKDGIPPRWPRWRANVNGDFEYNLLDITCLINFLYKGGPRPLTGAAWVR